MNGQEDVEEVKGIPEQVYGMLEGKPEKPEVEDSRFISDKIREGTHDEPKKKSKPKRKKGKKGKKGQKGREEESKNDKLPKIEGKVVQIPPAVTLACINLDKKPLKPILKKNRKYF